MPALFVITTPSRYAVVRSVRLQPECDGPPVQADPADRRRARLSAKPRRSPERLALLATALLLSLAWAARPHARSSRVGASACASCHTRIHDSWKKGRHSKMVQPATP